MPPNVLAWKNFNITPSRQCNILVVYAQFIFHQINLGQSTIAELAIGLDGTTIANELINTGSNHTYYPNPSHTVLGAVANVSAGTHTITLTLKPTMGDGVEMDHYYGWALGIS